MRALLVIMVVVSLVAFVGCGGKKARPVEDEDMKEPGAETPGGAVEPGAGEEPVKPIKPDEMEEPDLKAIHFNYDKYNLTSEATSTLAKNAKILMDNPNLRIRIEGHCDERGTDDYNLALGEKRAIAARDYLVDFGIAKSRLSVISYGEERPVDPASNEDAWAKNRRGEFVIR
jgi:peptidoglycan-associated lipoprotein